MHPQLMRANRLGLQAFSSVSKKNKELAWKIGVMGIIPITAFALGTWQIYRLKWKLKLIDEMNDRLLKPTAVLPNPIRFNCNNVKLFLEISLNWNIAGLL